MTRGLGKQGRQVLGAWGKGAVGVWAFLAVACTTRPPRATAIDADRAHVALADLEHGRQLLVAKCGASCHAAPLPSRVPAVEWPRALDQMSQRASLQPADRRLVELYLVTMDPR